MKNKCIQCGAELDSCCELYCQKCKDKKIRVGGNKNE